MKILLVEDDETTVDVLAQELKTYHYTVETALDGQIGLELAQAYHYDLVVLDIMLPNLDGISICRQLRSQGSQIPILMLSGREGSSDRVIGLEAGADDYVVKPYELSELIARIQALLRRGNSTLTTVLTWEKLRLYPDAYQVTYEGTLLHLTPKEYSILELFLRNPQRIFSRSTILDHIWPSGEFPQEEAVSTQIKGLRQKLKTAGMNTNLIETVYGLGYRLKARPEDFPAARMSPEEQSHPTSVPLIDKLHAQAKVQAVLQEIRAKFLESWKAQIMVFEDAIVQLSTGNLTQELRSSAQAKAHTLIGSLGSFGLPKGSQVAQQIEQLLRLDSPGEKEAQQLQNLLDQLEQIVTSKPFTTESTVDVKIGSGRLLVVDDDEILTAQIKNEAIIWGFQVEVATNPTAARKSIFSHAPDIIVLDLSFPDTAEDGISLLAELVQITPKIPVLVLTARNQLSDRVEVARLGGNLFLEKPISPEEIIKAVAHELHRTQKPEAKILIVDDDRQVLKALSALLMPWGFQVKTLAEPRHFWQTLATTVPDLLILDVEMPGFSGIELCQVVRSEPRWSDLPVLFLSGHNDREIIHQVFTVGADDYVQKPIIEPELIARILNRLERTRILHRFTEIDKLTGTATRDKSIRDLGRLLRLAERQNQSLCLMILHLDHFKHINDRYGHEVGDLVLSLFGKRLKRFFRSEDIVARWSGEEFVLGLYGITREEGAKRLNDFLLTWCQQEFTDANNHTFRVTFSAGVADYSQDGTKLQELYRAADAALSQAKVMGRNCVLVSNPASACKF
ncbi:multi-component transcriptional regulator [[Phormidium ambiguum] IAM M-71]|uniref:Multi-component transcriptional regulator n=1 Tax=[Phormidium ambiguum] IAM M-71 TaxID=454136 RepID=A0A1U7ILC0_9CYAN|nr:response regulator [Phormidium ambiguum]OKH38074.1 multi-component transcriptional regulator [Phormidium ambiguum IAM M-71]